MIVIRRVTQRIIILRALSRNDPGVNHIVRAEGGVRIT